VYAEAYFIGFTQTDTHTNWAMRKRTNSFQSWEMKRSRFSEKSTLAGELITAFSSRIGMYIWRSRTIRDRNVFGSSCTGIMNLAHGSFFSPPDIHRYTRKRVKSRMIYNDTLRGAYSRRHGITWCIPAVYTSQPTCPSGGFSTTFTSEKDTRKI